MQVKSIEECSNEHSAILSTSIKLPFSFKTLVLSIFKWPLKTGFTVLYSHNPLYLNSTNCSAAQNKRATRALDKTSLSSKYFHRDVPHDA